MPPQLLTLAVFCAVASGLVAQAERSEHGEHLEAILARHARTCGSIEAERATGDLELRGVVEASGGAMRWRALVRWEPFAVREEFTGQDGTVRVFVSNAERAWALGPHGQGAPLPAAAAIPMLHNAWLDGRRYLRAHDARADRPRVLPDWPRTPAELREPVGREMDTINFYTPTGTVMQGLFDRNDGRLHGAQLVFLSAGPFFRFGEWKRVGGLEIPMVRFSGHIEMPDLHTTVRVQEVVAGLRHADALFAGDPAQRDEANVEVGPLAIGPTEVPGAAYFGMPRVVVAGRGAAAAIFDTGAEQVCVRQDFARDLGLLPLAPRSVQGVYGAAELANVWLDFLEFPGVRLFQVPATSAALPGFPSFSGSRSPCLILGGPAWVGESPVLDLAAGKLWFRGRAPAPLRAAESRTPIARVPVAMRRSLLEIEVKVGDRAVPALLDTGIPQVLRLTTRALRRLGLPTGGEAWRARGALAFRFAGVAGTSGMDLLARLDELQVGEVRYLRPWVLLAGLGDGDGHDLERLPFEAQLGGGALLPFARVGIDGARALLELDPGDRLAPDEQGCLVVPDPGEYLGLRIDPRRGPGAKLYIGAIAQGSVADRAGLRAGDVLLAIDGVECAPRQATEVHRALWVPTGNRVTLRIGRKDEGEITVILP